MGRVFLSIVINIYSSYIQKDNPTLSSIKTFIFLLFDISQLVVLLYLTGGIFNPFIILILAPIIISASYLPALWTILLCMYSIFLILIINYYFVPLDWQQSFLTPTIYKIGILVALIITIIFIAIYGYLFANTSRKISNALSQTQIALVNQKKVSAIGSLAAAAAHELSTPLNTIFLILGRGRSKSPPPKRPLSQKRITWTVPVDATRPRAPWPSVRGVGEDDQSDRCCCC